MNFTIYSPNKEGQYLWVNLCVSVEEREGYRIYYLISKDVSDVKKMLDYKASRDTLTGLLNRGALEEQFKFKLLKYNIQDKIKHKYIIIYAFCGIIRRNILT